MIYATILFELSPRPAEPKDQHRHFGLVVPTGKLDGEGRPLVRAQYDFHSLRHAGASAWIKQRVDLKRLTTWLGHASVQTTLDVCGHLIKDEDGDAALVAAAQADFMA